MADGPVCRQVAAKIVKAGPDNGIVYLTGIGIMYKEHEILVEVNNDGSGVICAPLSFRSLSCIDITGWSSQHMH
jgi:hypothetical protein